MILTDQFLALILRDFTEFIIHILDFTLAVCQGYNGGFIQGKFQITQLMQRTLQPAAKFVIRNVIIDFVQQEAYGLVCEST